MKRLRELDESSPLLERAKTLLDACDALPESEERMWRIRRALDRPRARGLLGRRAPALVFCTCLLLLGASAFAAVQWHERVNERARVVHEQRTVEAARQRRARSQTAQRDVEAILPVLAEPAATLPTGQAWQREQPVQRLDDAVQASRALPPKTAQGAARSSKRRASSEGAEQGAQPKVVEPIEKLAPPPAADGEQAIRDSELVHRALKALRRDGDPALAARLLDRYRARAELGPLAEEALAMRIEAAERLRDARAATWAREYLGRYPNGRYRAVAQRALAESAR